VSLSFSLLRASSPRARRPLIAALTVTGTALAATTLAGPAHAATTQYKLTLSAIPNATFSAINNNGDIIGDAPQAGSSFTQPFILKAGGKPLFLSAPAGQAGNGFATADGLNNGDVVVGNFDTGLFSALKWPAGSASPADLSQLPTLANSFFNTQATAVNDNGLIVGFGETPGSNGDLTKSFTIQCSTVKVLPLLPRGSDANAVAVDPAGTTIAGNADTTTQAAMAVEWVNGAIKKLPALGSTFTSGALAVNAAGQVVGSAVLNSDGNAHALLWANGKATDLRFGAGGDAEATSINASGVAVGDGAVGDGGQHAFISQNGTATDLNALIPAGSGVTLNTAASINDHGVIVGTAATANGGTIGYELTPAG
jgi:probable HAF family extracellular repeat protein